MLTFILNKKNNFTLDTNSNQIYNEDKLFEIIILDGISTKIYYLFYFVLFV